MTVQELVQALHAEDPSAEVVIPGYESGVARVSELVRGTLAPLAYASARSGTDDFEPRGRGAVLLFGPTGHPAGLSVGLVGAELADAVLRRVD